MTGAIQVVTTTDSKEDAQRISRVIVELRLAACVQVLGPIVSTYWWQGKMETAEEWLCVIKTREERYAALEAAITEIHTYDIPEILATPIVSGNEAYLAWLREETRDEGPATRAP